MAYGLWTVGYRDGSRVLGAMLRNHDDERITFATEDQAREGAKEYEALLNRISDDGTEYSCRAHPVT